MLSGFQQYLIDKGFKRTCKEHCGNLEKEDYTNKFLSTYSPLQYDFKKDDKYCYWGLCECNKPPVMFLGSSIMSVVQNENSFRTKEDGYRTLFSQWHEDRYDEIYDVFMSEKKLFVVNCEDEKNILISIMKIS